MKRLFLSLNTVARIAHVMVAWCLVALVVVQVFHAGSAVLVNPGNWGSHENLGHLIGLPVLLLALLSLIGRMPVRFFLFSLGLWALYGMQYIFLHLPRQWGAPELTALHPVNALATFMAAVHVGRSSWRFVTEGWQPGAPARRVALLWVVGVTALIAAAVGLQSGDWQGEGGTKAPSLADAAEADLPERYRSMQSPVAPGDAAAVAAGREIAEKQCITCHGADFTGRELGGVRSADLTRAAANRSEPFLMWAISEGSQRGMPSFGSHLPEEQRWQLVAFLKSLKQ